MNPSSDRARVLYLTHNGLTEPLGRRQVLPYVAGLASRGYRITVLSFEKVETASPQAVARVEAIVAAAGVHWKPLRYHNRPRLIGTAFDVAQGLALSLRLAPSTDLIHARSTVPALVARLASVVSGRPWIFDLRGLVAEEYADAGHWRRGGLRYRATDAAERALVASADGLVTLTHKILERLPPRTDATPRPAAVIPCSVDPAVFRPARSSRQEVRRELGWGEEPALVYSGSLGSWYRLTEMLEFFEAARTRVAGLRFLLLTPQRSMAEEALRARRLHGVAVARSVEPDAVPRHLAACDAGICFLGRHRSKEASSPTKYGEYLASGLPVVTNAWIGDASALGREPAWVLVGDFAEPHYREAASGLARMLEDPAATQQAARELALREFALDTALERYDRLYRAVVDRSAAMSDRA